MIRKSLRHLRSTLFALLMLGVLAPHAHADESARTILFGRKKSLWLGSATGAGKPLEVARLGAPASEVTRLEASDDGGVILVELGEKSAIFEISDKRVAALRELSCSGRAFLSKDGNCVICPAADGKGTAVHRIRPSLKSVVIQIPGELLGFRARTPGTALASTRSGVMSFRISHKRKSALLAPERPDSGLLISPGGERAVGLYGGKTPSLYSFRLDGRGARRRLMAEARPVAWSRDSEWVLAQRHKDACLIRAVGGQYKCWDDFGAVTLSADGGAALLTRRREKGKGVDLYRGKIEGARAEKPALIWSKVSGPALILTPEIAR